MATALEFRGNPRDLHFEIAEKDGGFIILVTRGPEHKFKTMLSTTNGLFPTVPDAVRAVRENLESALTATEAGLDDDPELFLTQGWVDSITVELAFRKEANTWEMPVPVPIATFGEPVN